MERKGYVSTTAYKASETERRRNMAASNALKLTNDNATSEPNLSCTFGYKYGLLSSLRIKLQNGTSASS